MKYVATSYQQVNILRALDSYVILCLLLIYYFKLEKISYPLSKYSELETMLAMRKLGASYTILAEHFNVKKDTIIYLCRKFGLGGAFNPPIPRTTRVVKESIYTEDTINPGKTYAQYLQEEKDRKWKRLTQRK